MQNHHHHYLHPTTNIASTTTSTGSTTTSTFNNDTSTSTSTSTKNTNSTNRSKYRREILYCIENYSIVILVSHSNPHHNNNTFVSPATFVPTDLYDSIFGDHHHHHDHHNDHDHQCNILVTSPHIQETLLCAQRTTNDILSLQQSNQQPSSQPPHANTTIVGCTTEIIPTHNNHNDNDNNDNNENIHHKIRYVTHDVVLHEISTIDPLLLRYNIIIVNQITLDRIVSTDILLGLLHKIRHYRNNNMNQNMNQNQNNHHHHHHHNNKILRLVLLVNTNNDYNHQLVTTILQYFLGPERAQQCIHRCCTKVSTIINENDDENYNNNNNNYNIHDDGMVLSLYDHPLCPVNIYYLSEPTSDYIVSMIETIWYILIHPNNNKNNSNNNSNNNNNNSSSSSNPIKNDPTTTTTITSGDILCFVPSYNDITTAIPLAQEYIDQQYNNTFKNQNSNHRKDNMDPQYNVDFLPFSTSLPHNVQEEILQPQQPNNNKWTSQSRRQQQQQQRRRVIFTNINAERTSITIIPNIQYVIDCGYTEISSYFDANIGLNRNACTIPISQQHAQQRTSYASTTLTSTTNSNKTTNSHNNTTKSTFVVGQCYRLYTELYMTEKMSQATLPEITRTDMTNVILLLKSIGIDNIFTFDFITLPNIESIRYGLETLYVLGAIDDTTTMTPMGYDMAQLFVEPRLARMLLESIPYHCTWEVITIASVMHVQQQQQQWNDSHTRPYHILQTKPKHHHHQQVMDYEDTMSNVADVTGDHLSYWNIFSDIDQQYGSTVDNDYCNEHYLQYNTIRQCLHVRKHLARSLKRVRTSTTIGVFHPRSSNTGGGGGGGSNDQQQLLLLYDRSQAIRRCVTTGYIMNVAKLHNDGQYYTIRNDGILVVPTTYSFYTSFSKVSSEYIVFCQSGSTGGRSNNGIDTIEIQHVSSIEAKWLREIAPDYFL